MPATYSEQISPVTILYIEPATPMQLKLEKKNAKKNEKSFIYLCSRFHFIEI